ncbi:glycosyltransferase family 4 protein [Rouxiella silvae]|uniref:Glycosyltransferase family 4 protein n=1 Tax=Rouxiella silvae TaxID=1646373 RepID=A0AA40X026_9GAMM|nr:glycosyltransferase family 4 protein [Rouxiella silvae]KQN43715.1 hypothetical protein ASE93_18275 [Serratia sp. Leaf50]MBF6636236.1 glycosyltransferase family 4 protein [Rouxiella silvae]
MKIKKKIGILIDNITNSGGTERVASILSSGLVDNGYDVQIFSLVDGNPFFPMHESIAYWKGKNSNRVAKLVEISRFLKNNKFKSVIIISMGKLSFQSLPILKLLARNVKLISCDHVSIESFKNPLRILKCLSYSLADEVCVLTEYDKNYLTSKYKVRNVNVIRNISPYQTTFFDENEILKKDKVVIGVGRLTYQKNFKRLIDIWSNTETEDWVLQIIGTGEEFDDLKNYITSINLQDSVKLIGSNNDMTPFYAKASILCMTSRYEGLPMVLIECKNFGVPAISFDCKTGPQELIDGDGFLIPYDDDINFSEKLKVLITDEKVRLNLSQRSFLNAQNYTSEKIVGKWVNLIEK